MEDTAEMAGGVAVAMEVGGPVIKSVKKKLLQMPFLE
jgi:hypothetical protein